jgi:hypothetical protein
LKIETEHDKRTGQSKVKSVAVHGEALEPTDRFWTSLYARYGFGGSVFKYFRHNEVLERIAQTETDNLRVCIERDGESGNNRLLAVSNPAKPIVVYDDLMNNLAQYQGQDLIYADGVIESTKASGEVTPCGFG